MRGNHMGKRHENAARVRDQTTACLWQFTPGTIDVNHAL